MSRTLLYIEDDESLVRMWRSVLQAYGHGTEEPKEPLDDSNLNQTIDMVIVHDLKNAAGWYSGPVIPESDFQKAKQLVRQEELKPYALSILVIYTFRHFFQYTNPICVLVDDLSFAPKALVPAYQSLGANFVLEKPLSVMDFVRDTLPFLYDKPLASS
ncbi:MAG: hypothetical protein V1837_03565 [Candidatus Woesearchaeota archaeon]